MLELLEGQHDKYTQKAIFLIGIPASGKTEFYYHALKHKHLKHMDSDKVMAFLVGKHGGSLRDTSNYTRWQKSVAQKLDAMSDMYKSGKLGLVIDGTGRNIEKIKEIKKNLEDEHGYKTAMVFINTPLTKAIEKAKRRDRAVDLSYIKKVYSDLSKNTEEYRKIFNPFIEVNSVKEYDKAERKVNRWLDA